MENGYYLSVYICIDGLGHIKKFETRHDFNMALWLLEEGSVSLIHYWEFERMSGIKQHGRSFFSLTQAEETINSLLHTYNLSLEDMVEIWGFPEYCINASSEMKKYYPEIYYHSICHLFSSMLMSMKTFKSENILALALDGSPDYLDYDKKSKFFFAAGYSKLGKILEIYPISSPAELWTAAKMYFKLREGTLMALAYASKSCAYVDFQDAGVKSFKDMAVTNEAAVKLFDMIMNFSDEDKGIKFNYFDPRFTQEENKISMAMKVIQKESYKIMEQNIDKAIAKFNINPCETVISLSGGFALNCPTNSYILKKYNFKGFIAPPCINDGGISLGIGLGNFFREHKEFDFEFKNAFYGCEDKKLMTSLIKYKEFISNIECLDYNKAAKDIQREPIVWFDGRSEIGPRALGHRSLFANPGKIDAKNKLNIIKQREWWRPVAPIILEDKVCEWFENGHSSPYMLHNFKVKSDKKEKICAILHLDDTARVQTINKEMDENVYSIIEKFYENTGIPMICNTSLNDKGEPIINSINEAFNFALRKQINVMYVNGIRISLVHHEKFLKLTPAEREIEMDILNDEDKEDYLKEENPYGLEDNILHYYVTTNKKYEMNLNLKNEKDVKILKKMYKYHQSVIKSDI